LRNKPHELEKDWSLFYSGPQSEEIVGVDWRVSSLCRTDKWSIRSRDGRMEIVHSPHAEDDLDCYLMFSGWQFNPEEDLKLVYSVRTPDDPTLIRDMSCVLNGSLEHEQNPDHRGYTVCTGSNYNQEARIARRLCKVISLPERLAPSTDYRIEVFHAGGLIHRTLYNLSLGQALGTVDYIDHDPLCRVPGYIGLFTFSGAAIFYDIEIYTRPSRLDLKNHRMPFDIETRLNTKVGDQRVFKLHLAWDDKPGRNLHRILFEDVTSRRAAEDQLTAQRDLSTRLGEVTEVGDALELCLEAALRVSGTDCGGVYLVNAEKGLDLVCSRGLSEDFLSLVGRLGPESFQAGLIMQGRPVYIHYREMLRQTGRSEYSPDNSLRALCSLPVLHEGALIACINVASRQRDEFTPVVRSALEAVAVQIGGVIARIRAEQALRESEARFRAVVEDQTELIGRFLPDGTLTFLNEATTRYYGIEAEKMLGHNMFHFITEEDRDRVQQNLLALTPDNPVLNIENRSVLSNGCVRWQQWTNRAIFNREGRLVEFQAVGRDITELRQMEQERIKSEKLFSLGVLAGGIAHDFNNLLGAVMINISMARRSLAGNGEVLDLIHDIEEAALRARDLTQQLLTFSKGGAPIRKPTCVNDLIRNTTRFALRGSNVRSELDFDPEPWDADIDSGQISQVLHNLVLNAIQAMPAGGVVRVMTRNVTLAKGEVASLAAGRYIRVSVRDHGRGITPETMPHIFDPYFTSKAHGSGLGLATSYSIIKRHNGHISVVSESGRGAEFIFYLPAADLHPALQSRGGRKGRGTKPVTGSILVMDDEPLYRDSLARALTNSGHRVRTAGSGLEALEMYELEFKAGRRFDLVIMDLTIPGGMGGKETLSRIRRLDPEVRAVVSSGYSNDQVLADFRHYGFSGIIPKPYRVEELLEVVSTVMRKRRPGGSGSAKGCKD
ncbi:PAS domain S-box protein, partial [bacterium]|nr:PAS domain S-box protein [bacterium]